MKLGVFLLMNGLFVLSAAQLANVPAAVVIAKFIQPLLAIATLVQQFIS